MKIRTLIVDDEPLARLNLSSLLAQSGDFEVVAECADVPAARVAIATLQPALAFVDVQMPGLDGFSLTGERAPPALVFVTAHEQYAARAFDVHAVDYLLKPFKRARFEDTLERVRRRLGRPAAATETALEAGRMLVKSGTRWLLVAFDEIDFVRAAANYVSLHCGDTHHEVRYSIGVFEQRLPPGRFVRIHRSYIVNIAALRSLNAVGGGECVAALRSGRELPVGANWLPLVRRSLQAAGV